MNNTEAQNNIDKCLEELQRIYHLVEGHGTSQIVHYLTNYSVVRACGSIEFCFKTIISDSLSVGHSSQIANYIDNTIRNSSMNPSKDKICSTLKKFDENWNSAFKAQINRHEYSDRLQLSLNSLNSSRNSFAHGDPVSSSFEDIRNYFNDSVLIIKMLDSIVN
jgi:hypothetical protein